MPVVTSARAGRFVGTGVPAREKLRIPAAASAKPMRIREPAMIQWTRSILGTGQRQQAIQDEAEQKSGEKAEERSRDDARSFGVGHLLPSRVLTHARSRRTKTTTRLSS